LQVNSTCYSIYILVVNR